MKTFQGHYGSSGSHPNVVALDDITPGDKTGWAWESDLVNEVIGFFQAILLNAGVTPSGLLETSAASQLLDSLKLGFVNGLEGGTYTPSALLTWNNQLVIDASAAPSGTNLDGITVTGKGTGRGGLFQGGPGGVGAQFTGGALAGINAVVGVYAVGANALSGNYAGGEAVYGIGGEGFGDGNGGAGIRGRGGEGGAGNFHGVGGKFLGYGASYSVATLGEGVIAVGGPGAVALILQAGTDASHIHMVPRGTAPTSGALGDFYCDSAGFLFRCAVPGVPPTLQWVKLADTP